MVLLKVLGASLAITKGISNSSAVKSMFNYGDIPIWEIR